MPTKTTFYLLIAILCIAILPLSAKSQSCTNIGGVNPPTITQNFDGLGNSPAPANSQANNLFDLTALLPNNPPASRFLGRFDNTLNDAGGIVNVPWGEIEEGPASSSISGRYNVGDGTAAGGNTYSYASTMIPSDRALGSLTNTGIDRNLLGTCFVNTTGLPVTVVYINFTGEQWRNGGSNVQDRLDFQYAVDLTPAVSDNIFTANGGIFTDFDALDFASPVTGNVAAGLNGNVAPNRTVVFQVAVPLTFPANSILYLRWADLKVAAGNSDDGLAIDDFRISLISLSPSAANVSVSGRVLGQDGRSLYGIGSAIVTLTDSNGRSRTAFTNPFGYYRFEEVESGATYVLSTRHKRHSFGTQIVSVNDNLDDLNIIAQ